MRHKYQINNDRINEDHSNLIHAAGEGFADSYRECAHAFGFVIVMLVNVLGNIDAGDTQPIRNAGKDNIPDVAEISTPNKRHDQVNAADHDRSPDEEDCKLTESPIFEWIGICQQHDRT